MGKPDIFPDFEFLGYWQTQFNDIVAIAVFFAWIKVSSGSKVRGQSRVKGQLRSEGEMRVKGKRSD